MAFKEIIQGEATPSTTRRVHVVDVPEADDQETLQETREDAGRLQEASEKEKSPRRRAARRRVCEYLLQHLS